MCWFWHHPWWHSWPQHPHLVQLRLSAEGICSWVFVVWLHVVTRFQMETTDVFFNNLTTFKTGPTRSSHPQVGHTSHGLLVEAPGLLDVAGACQHNTNAMQINCRWNWEILHLLQDLQSEWKWQWQLAWIPLKSLTSEGKAEQRQLM